MEDVAFLDILGSLPSCEWLLAVSKVADEIEVVHIGHSLVLLEGLQVDSSLAHQVGNFRLAFCLVPTKNKVVEAGISAENVLSGIVCDAFRMEQFPVNIIDGNSLADDFHPTSVPVDEGYKKSWEALGLCLA